MFCLPFLGPLRDGANLKNDPMHFWIKGGGEVYGISGGRSRVPASMSAGRRRRRSKPMVTPVHRLPPTVPPGTRPGSACRRPTSGVELRPNTQPYITPSISYGASRQSELESAIYIEGPLEPHLDLAPSTTSVGPNRLKYWMMALFSLVIVALTAVKFYYSVENGGNKMDISIASSMSLLAAGLMASCLLSGCRNKGPPSDFLVAQPTPQHTTVPSTDVEVAAVSGRDEVLLVLHNPPPPSSAPLGPPPEQEAPPPPYHLAILLPPRESILDESPPPAYEKAVLR